MRKREFKVPLILIGLGLICLTTSGSFLFGQKLGVYLKTFASLSMWMAVPIIVGVLFYLLFMRKRR